MKRTVFALLAGGALSALATLSALAHHHEFYTTDSSKQESGGNGLSENYANWRWSLTTNDVLWASDSGIRSEVITAISEWESEYPGLSWQEDTSSPQVTFAEESSCGGSHALWTVSSWTEDEAANYWITGVVCVNTSVPWADVDELVAGISHEIGHVHGLHERYRDNQFPLICNPSGEVTIMDGPEPTALAQSTVVHCDSPIAGPVTWDKIRVNDFYGGGELFDWASQVNGSSYTIRWKDFARAEYKHQMKFFYWNGSVWVEYDWRNHTGDIGSSAELPVSWLMQETIDTTLGSYGIPTGQWNTHVVCGDPWYMHDSSAGDWTCSPTFDVFTPS